MVQEEKLFKDISYLDIWQPLCSVDHNHLCNFDRVDLEEQFCEIILKLDQWIRCRLKTFLSRAVVVPLFGRAKLFVHFW